MSDERPLTCTQGCREIRDCNRTCCTPDKRRQSLVTKKHEQDRQRTPAQIRPQALGLLEGRAAVTIWWNHCTICGKDFASTDPASTVCTDKKRHAEINTEKRTRKNDEGGEK